MFNIIKKLKKFAKETEFEGKVDELSDEAKKMIKVKLLRQDIENLINPSSGKYNTKIKDVQIDFDK